MRIGIMGGSFDPVHLGHILVAEDVLRQLRLKVVLFVPTYHPSHRPMPLASFHHRFNMIKLATSYHPQFAVSDLEKKQPIPSYTVNTLRHLTQIYPRAKLFFILGYDQYAKIKTWHRPDELTKLSYLIVISRPGFKKPKLFPGHDPNKIRFLSVIPVAITSQEIRQRLFNRMSIRYLVPGPVRRYIDQHRLYKFNLKEAKC